VLKKSNICPKILFLLSDNFSAEIWVHKIDPWTASHTTMAMTSQILVHLWPARRLASTTHCSSAQERRTIWGQCYDFGQFGFSRTPIL
jgi:hypothetical protein